MESQYRLELITYSIRCTLCRRHVPVYLHPIYHNTEYELTRLFCRRCLPLVEYPHIKGQDESGRFMGNRLKDGCTCICHNFVIRSKKCGEYCKENCRKENKDE
ncbi:hypothetical protein LCGC14_0176500 [marine sediment metagenome]|uniref:Uncharacterized protein n=1 Tax=marine sediment metagenome TaxID=412755 RepID=A0A0F9X9Y5_9ZZZZ